MKYFTRLLSVLILFSTICYAQNELSFEFDYARFKYDTTSVYMEFYYDLNPRNMVATPIQNGHKVEAIVHVEMKDLSADTFYINKNWRIESIVIDSLNGSYAKSLTGVFGFVIPKGEYSLMVKAYDAKNSAFAKTINEKLSIMPFHEEKFSVSDIQLASNIKKDNADPLSLFYKNTLEVIPNPSMVYSEKSPVAFYYSELYDIISENPNSSFTLQKLLYNSAGMPVYKTEKQIKQGAKSIVEYGLLNLVKYPTDSYNLVLNLIENESKQAFISAKRFYFYNPSVVDSSSMKRLDAGLIGSEFAVFTLEECDLMFDQAKYIAVQKEIDQYKTLNTVEGKREFLFNFWQNRDSNPSTPLNEFKNEYMRRIDFVTRNFTISVRKGYLTERGRVYLTYGEPDQRDFYPSEINKKPYEIWFYNDIEGGVSFIFGDVTGFGNYELLHSTKRGEIRDDNWEMRISSQF